MKKLIFPILLILVVIGGAVGGDFLKTRANASHVEAHADASSEPRKKAGQGDVSNKKKKEGHEKSGKQKEGLPYTSETEQYLKFKRQFVVPVMLDGRIDALVIMNLNLVLGSDAPANAYSLEPKLRDALTRELLNLSNQGVFGEGLTSAKNYEVVRKTLLSASQSVMPDGVKDILILDIARQEH